MGVKQSALDQMFPLSEWSPDIPFQGTLPYFEISDKFNISCLQSLYLISVAEVFLFV